MLHWSTVYTLYREVIKRLVFSSIPMDPRIAELLQLPHDCRTLKIARGRDYLSSRAHYQARSS